MSLLGLMRWAEPGLMNEFGRSDCWSLPLPDVALSQDENGDVSGLRDEFLGEGDIHTQCIGRRARETPDQRRVTFQRGQKK